MTGTDAPALVRRVDQFSPSRDDHVVATATCCCCCCCLASTLLTGLSFEKQLTQALLEAAPKGAHPESVVVDNRTVRWLAGGSTSISVVLAVAFVAIGASVRNVALLFFIVAIPGLSIALLSVAYADGGLPRPPRIAVKGLVFFMWFAFEFIASLFTFGLVGLAAAVIGTIAFLVRAFQPPRGLAPPHPTASDDGT